MQHQLSKTSKVADHHEKVREKFMSIPSTKPVFESPRATTNNSQVGAASNGKENNSSGIPMTDKPAEGRRQHAAGPAYSLYAENGTEEDQTELISD